MVRRVDIKKASWQGPIIFFANLRYLVPSRRVDKLPKLNFFVKY
jgi:hypothetical protein